MDLNSVRTIVRYLYTLPKQLAGVKSKNQIFIIKSEYLTEGLFGQILCWCLEVLPYLEKHKLKPEWRVLSRNYGTSPTFNIFPDILRTNYEPSTHAGVPKILSFEQLKAKEGHPSFSFQSDFALANRLFTKYFRLPNEVTTTVEEFFLPYAGKRILGLHYRGTDKLVDNSQTNRVTAELMLCVARDMLEKKGDIDLVFLASDEESFLAKVSEDLPVPVISFQQGHKASNQERSSGIKNYEAPFRGHNKNQNTEIGRLALIDSLLLSRCDYLLKCQSALSGWAKIWNPNLEAYRIAAFKHDWFPDAFIPLYKTDNCKLNAELMIVQEGEISQEVKLKASLPVSAYLTR